MGRLRKFGLLFMVVLLLGACTGGGAAKPQSKEPVKIGVITILSGPYAIVGEEMMKGLRVAVKMKGTINGRPIQLVVEDDENKPDVSIRKATKLAQEDKVPVIHGPIFSGTASGVAGNLDRLGIPIVTVNAYTLKLTEDLRHPMLFRAGYSDGIAAEGVARLITKDPKAQAGKWYILGNDYEWGHSSATAFKSKAKVNVVGEAFAPLETNDWSVYLQRIKASDAEYVYIPIAFGAPLLDFLKQAAQFGITPKAKIILPGIVGESTLYELKDAAVGLTTSGPGVWMLEDRYPEAKAFNEAFYKEHNRPPEGQAISSAVAMMITMDALERASDFSPASVRKALRAANVKTPIGQMKFRGADQQMFNPAIFATATKLDQPKYGVSYAWKPFDVVKGEDIVPAPGGKPLSD